MLTTSDSDLMIVIIVTSIGIMAVIFLLLRSLLASIYMVITVLLNYGATLGITAWIFQDLLHYNNLINMLPVFLFVILAAVGADYNIFLVSRIREEIETHSIKEAVHRAVANTGNVITSCGIILAGTFATLSSSSFPMVMEIGVAIAIGVIIDTFVVRALLVPSLAVLCGRWGWWPAKQFKTLKKD
jgi:RND superfamily putative drug exporter